MNHNDIPLDVLKLICEMDKLVCKKFIHIPKFYNYLMNGGRKWIIDLFTSICMEKYYTSYMLDNQLHREDDLPALVHSFGFKYWYRHGKVHREGGPAYISIDCIIWYKDGLYHRTDGPAVICYDGSCTWWQNGKRLVVADTTDYTSIFKYWTAN
jgi:hypothetical protein